METLLITFDTRAESVRQAIAARVSTFGEVAKLSQNSFAVSTNMSAPAIFDDLSEHIDSNDQLYVIKLAQPYEGQGPEEIGHWFSNYLS